MRRRTGTAIVAVLAIAFVVAVAGAAAPGDGPTLMSVPSANTRSPGFAPVSKLAPELRQIAVAQGSTKLENGTAQVSHYGYDNDVVNAAGEAADAPDANGFQRGAQDRARQATYEVIPAG